MPKPEHSESADATPPLDRADAIAAIIKRRRTVHAFDPDRPVPDAVLVRLLELAAQAPSSHNLQPWRFIVLRSARNRQRLAHAAYGHQALIGAPIALIVLGARYPHRSHLEPILSRQESFQRLPPDEQAAQRGRIIADRERRDDSTIWSVRSTMLAVGTVLLAAEAHGLATCLIDVFDETRVRESFGVPDDHALACLLAIGFAAAMPANSGRLPLGELVFDEFFGQPSTLCPLEDSPLAPPPATE